MSTELIVSLVVAVFASTGLWTFISKLIDRHDKKRIDVEGTLSSVSKKLEIIGENVKATNRATMSNIYYKSIARGYIRQYEYETFIELYTGQKLLNGNHFADRMKQEIEDLEVKNQ